MKIPTIGKIVHFIAVNEPELTYVYNEETKSAYVEQPLAAIICYVHPDYTVNLVIFSSHGYVYTRQNIKIVTETIVNPLESYAKWPEMV